MKKTHRLVNRGLLAGALMACLFGVFPPGATAGDDIKLKQVRTEFMRLIYLSDDHYFIIPHLTRCFENSLHFHRELFDYTPSEYVTLIFQDMDDHGYAGTTTMPYNYLTLGIEPFEHVYETSPTNERINWVMSHELLHVVAADQAAGTDRFFRKVFTGKVAPTAEDPVSILYSYLTNPRRYAPRWYHEGLAVFMETWMAGGIGRAQNGYDEMVFRAMVRDSTYFYDIVGIESEGTAADFQMGQLSYLYGTRFVSYLVHQHGPESIIDWAKRQPGTKRSFARQFKQVYGQAIQNAWREWVSWEKAWQQANLDSIAQYPVTEVRRIPVRALGSVSRSFYDPDTRQLFAAVRYPGDFARIVAVDIDTGQMRQICDLDTPALYFVTSLAYDESSGTLFYTTNNARGWRNLRAVDIATGATRRLLKWARTGDLAFNRADRSLWGIMHHGGRSHIVRLPPPYDAVYDIMPLSYRQDFYDIDVSPDGKYLTGTLVDVGGRSKLVRVDLEQLIAGGAELEELWEFEQNAPLNFVHSPDGRHLYGTSYLTGTSNVFRYDLEAQTMNAVTNTETGFFRPIVAGSDSLIVYEYTGGGMRPVIIADDTVEDIAAVRYLGNAIAEKFPQVDDWKLDSPLTVDFDSVLVYEGDYNPLRSLRLNTVYPIVEGYKEYTSPGLRFDLSDPVGLHAAHVAVSYSGQRGLPDDERLHARFEYKHHPWNLWGAWNRADFYDLFGPTKISRKGFQLGLRHKGFWLEETPRTLRYNLRLARYWGLEVLPEFQNVPTSFDDFLTFGASLAYSTAQGTIGGIEAEKGFLTSLNHASVFVRGDYFARTWANLTYGFLTPIDHSSLWLRAAGGAGSGPLDEPFANFFFGAFGNNYVDHGRINRYRGTTSFPGLEIDEVGGRTFAKGGVEWTLPPLRFRKFGFTNFYATWLRLSLFGNGIVTNPDQAAWRQEVWDVGAQLNLKLILFFSLESTLSAGYARAFAEDLDPRDEVMVSLKILR
jgi:hypothetical protein